MNLVAHVAGVPVEEALLSLSSVGGALLVARGWLALHWRRRANVDTQAESSASNRSSTSGA